MVMWLLIGLAAVLVVVVALVAVGREAFTLGSRPRDALFDLDEAVGYVADHLPGEVTAKLSYDDVRNLITWHLAYLDDHGVPEGAKTEGPGEVGSSNGAPRVFNQDDVASELLLQAEAAGLAIDALDVVTVLDAEQAYLREIGAIGPPVDEAGRADDGELPPGQIA